jgi:hypothetical protein
MKTLHLKSLAVVALSALSVSAFATGTCTSEPKTKWMKPQDVQTQLEQQGHKVKRVKTEGSCYEAYTTDKAGKKAELVLNPVDGKIVKQEDE